MRLTQGGPGRASPSGPAVTELVTFDFWQTLFAETAEGLPESHALRVAGVGDGLPRAGHDWDAAALAVADARAASAFAAIWSQHRNMPPAEEVRMYLAALDPALPEWLSAESLRGVTATYEEPG